MSFAALRDRIPGCAAAGDPRGSRRPRSPRGRGRAALSHNTGPARVFDPGSGLEVDRVELRDTAAPDRGRTAEEPEATLLEEVIGKADRFAGPEILQGLLVVRPPLSSTQTSTPSEASRRARLSPAAPEPTIQTLVSKTARSPDEHGAQRPLRIQSRGEIEAHRTNRERIRSSACSASLGERNPGQETAGTMRSRSASSGR